MSRFNIIEGLSPDAQRSYKSLYIKLENISNKIECININNDEIINDLPIISEEVSNNLLNSIFEFSEYIYSCSEYIGQIIRIKCREIFKGEELSDGFNSILLNYQKYIVGNKKSKIYSHVVIGNYLKNANIWYDIIHCIRTEETHYGTGRITIDENNTKYLRYENVCRSGRGNKREINISIKKLNIIYLQFCDYVKQLDDIIIYLDSISI